MISVQNIRKSFGEKTVLRDVSLSVKEASIYGLIGHNGAGKTTLMSIMAGLNKADSGSCDYGGKRISYLPDIPGFFEYLTAEEYIQFLMSGAWNGPKSAKEDILRQVGLDGRVRISRMSRGMRQRLGIAAALVNDPDILLLDEPTSALDPAGRMELMQILRDLREQGKSVLLSTHILADMENLCDEVGFLHKGIIQRSVNVRELNNRNAWIVQLDSRPDWPDTSFEQVSVIGDRLLRIELGGDDHIKNQQNALQWLSSLGSGIVSIRNESRTLEDLFQEVCTS
ncbi:MAG: ABC transporter ATP-binding protein [Lachnospiraceae bacterium]|nr:ABC transporter ATP-binding protein [Lachnospiraceae bacterium]